MIRLNVFFEAKDASVVKDIETIGHQLVCHSLSDKGCVNYALLHQVDDELKFMICETWADSMSLSAHEGQKHFVELVPRIESLTKEGMKLEKFVF